MTERRERSRSAPERREQHRRRARELFEALAALPACERRRSPIRAELIEMHLPLARFVAHTFLGRGEPVEDLVQVATLGLIKSVDHFDPGRGVSFPSYAVVGITGEVKRHFRDTGWAVHVTRRIQEVKLQITVATEQLSQQLGAPPTIAQLAAHLHVSEEEVLEGLAAANAYATTSLDAAGDDEDTATPGLAGRLATVDAALEGVEYHESLKPLVARLPARERKILLLRFFGNQTQSQIAEQMGLSQMHVSRLLARTLAQLGEQLLAEQ